MLENLLQRGRVIREELKLSVAAKEERRKDQQGLPSVDPGIDRAIDEGAAWLARAQDFSTSQDGGVAHSYCLINGWASSYPETTGYIVPTMLVYAKLRGDDQALKRARRMLDWLVKIQYPEGGFQGGCVDSTPVVPVAFNTGQILLGLTAGARVWGDCHESMRRAADWLVQNQDDDGCWRNNISPFGVPGEKTFDTHVAWALLEAARLQVNRAYEEAALANVHWALTKQNENGWLDGCCLSGPSQPLTHTLGYALRGIIEAYRYLEYPDLLAAAQLTAEGLLSGLRDDGFLSGRFLSDWSPAVDWVCLTGSVQIALCWLMLYRYTGDTRYRDAGFLANKYVRRTIKIEGLPEIRGAVKGTFPVDGQYNPYKYLNWAVKFCVDSNILELAIREEEGEPLHEES